MASLLTSEEISEALKVSVFVPVSIGVWTSKTFALTIGACAEQLRCQSLLPCSGVLFKVLAVLAHSASESKEATFDCKLLCDGLRTCLGSCLRPHHRLRVQSASNVEYVESSTLFNFCTSSASSHCSFLPLTGSVVHSLGCCRVLQHVNRGCNISLRRPSRVGPHDVAEDESRRCRRILISNPVSIHLCAKARWR